MGVIHALYPKNPHSVFLQFREISISQHRKQTGYSPEQQSPTTAMPNSYRTKFTHYFLPWILLQTLRQSHPSLLSKPNIAHVF